MKTKVNALEDLRREKEIARLECQESEAQLAEHWEYLKDNAGSLIVQSATVSIARKLGFGGLFGSKDKDQDGQEQQGTLGVMQNVWNGVVAYYPLIWEMAQPFLIRFATKKIKSLFSGKKKKKRRDEEED